MRLLTTIDLTCLARALQAEVAHPALSKAVGLRTHPLYPSDTVRPISSRCSGNLSPCRQAMVDRNLDLPSLSRRKSTWALARMPFG
jgi:hypothetical protein